MFRLDTEADLQPTSNVSPDHVALDATVIRINGQQFRLFAVVNTDTVEFLHVRLFSTALTQWFLRERREKYDADDAVIDRFA